MELSYLSLARTQICLVKIQHSNSNIVKKKKNPQRHKLKRSHNNYQIQCSNSIIIEVKLLMKFKQ